MDRDEMERDLTFQGLIIFRNELRKDSAATIAKLKVLEVFPVCGVWSAHLPQEFVFMRCTTCLITK